MYTWLQSAFKTPRNIFAILTHYIFFQILSVNGISLEGLTHQEAVNILKNCEGTVLLQILS